MIRVRPDALVCDLDGVVYRDDVPIRGAASAIERLRAAGIRFLFCTNNSTRTTRQYVDKLASVGVEAREEEVLTSGAVAAEHLRAAGLAGRSAFVVGGAGIYEAVHEVGLTAVNGGAAERAAVVLVGGDPSFDYAALTTAARAVRAGARFIATNDDPTFPAPEGLRPGAGAIVAAIETASGARATVLGKPYRPMMEAAQRRLRGARQVFVVGDQAATDLAGAELMGWTKVLVLSGVTGAADVPSLPVVPDLVFESLTELAREVEDAHLQ